MGSSIDWEEFDDRTDFPTTRIKFEKPGDSVAGTITNIRVTDFGGTGERAPELWINNGSDEVSVVASQTNLRRALAGEKPAVGDRIAIVYTGDGKSNKAGFSPPKLFDVKVARAGSTEPVAAPMATAAVPSAANLI